MSSAASNDPFYGNDPADVWDEGYEAALAGRSRTTNPFRSGEVELLDRISRGGPVPPHEDPVLDGVEHVKGTSTQVTPEQMDKLRGRPRRERDQD